jgi:aryl-alcohol dehydrogenase-like predicted oxidoreductase
MDYRQLGASGLRVSTITLGTMGFAGTGWAQPVGNLDVDGARRQISLARDAGVNLFDTADVYSAGQSEEILGAALGSDRDDVLIATKVRM